MNVLVLDCGSSPVKFQLKVSLGQTARVAGYSERGFMNILGRHKIPVFNYPAEDLQQELSG